MQSDREEREVAEMKRKQEVERNLGEYRTFISSHSTKVNVNKCAQIRLAVLEHEFESALLEHFE